MNCLCCGKEIKETAKQEEKDFMWHFSCVKKFFGTKTLPIIDLSDETLELLAEKTVENGYTVPGVQKKLSLHLTVGNTPRLTLVNYPTGYILKPQTNEYSSLPESEYLIMKMAELTKIKTVPFALIKTNMGLAYITKRIDRNILEDSVEKYAMEDFCQLENRLTEDKYKGSYERCAKVIDKYSTNPNLDKVDLFIRIIFSYVVGNSDMHLKNFSLISYDDKNYKLSDAYDMLPVNVIIPSDTEEFALTLNGKKKNITKNDIFEFAKNINLTEKVAKNILDKITKLEKEYIDMCDNSLLPNEMKENLKTLIHSRIKKIS